MKNSWMSRPLSESDPEIARAIANETNRQHEGLELIASENFVSMAILEAAGSVFTNKYADSMPTFSRIQDRRPTWRLTCHCCNRAIR